MNIYDLWLDEKQENMKKRVLKHRKHCKYMMKINGYKKYVKK